MSIEQLARELEEMRTRVKLIEARLDSIEPEPTTLPGGSPSVSPLLDTVGDAIDALFGERRG